MKIELNDGAAVAIIAIAIFTCFFAYIIRPKSPCKDLIDQRNYIIVNAPKDINSIAKIDSLIICTCNTK